MTSSSSQQPREALRHLSQLYKTIDHGVEPPSYLNLTDAETPEEEERHLHALVASHLAEDNFLEFNERILNAWGEFNSEYFGGELQPPHISVGQTSPRALAEFKPHTGTGTRIEFRFRQGIVFGTANHLVHGDFRSLGVGRFLEDQLLRLMARQYVYEIEDNSESGYGGWGPRFTELANEIGQQLGLPVFVERNRSGEPNRPLAKYWPHPGRPCEYYDSDITPLLLERACGHTSPSSRQHVPTLGILEWIQGMLRRRGEESTSQALGQIIDRLQRRREGHSKKLRRIESGEIDRDGNPIPEIQIQDRWLTANNAVVAKMTQDIQRHRLYAYAVILADALEEAGCDSPHILNHLREEVEHTCSCWVLKRLDDATQRLGIGEGVL